MKVTIPLAALTAFLALTSPFWGQQGAQAVHLQRPTNWSPTDLTVSMITGTTVCDSAPNVYLRLVKGNEAVTQAPFRVMRPNGQSFGVEPATTLPDRLIVTAFGVDSDGNILATLQLSRGSQWYIATFDQNGKLTGKASLSEDLTPFFILPLKDHRVVIGGVRPQTSAEEQHVSSLVAFFDANGQMVKSLSLPDDDADEEVTKRDVGKRTFFSVYNRAIARGRAVLGTDGNIYILRASSIPKVQVVDPEGNSQRVLSLAPPASDTWPTNFYVLGDSIAVGYFESKQENVCLTEGNFTLYDRLSGNPTANFVVPLSPDLFLCAQNHSLIYLKAPKGASNYQWSHIEIPVVDHMSQAVATPNTH